MEVLCGRLLPYIDAFPLSPSVGRASDEVDCRPVSKEVDALIMALKLESHEIKGVWRERSTCVEHLRLVWDTVKI